MTRRVLLNDLSALARILMPVEPADRQVLARHVLERAGHADKYRKRLKRPHPRWGDGTVASATRGFPRASRCGFDNSEYCVCFETALTALLSHRSARAKVSASIA